MLSDLGFDFGFALGADAPPPLAVPIGLSTAVQRAIAVAEGTAPAPKSSGTSAGDALYGPSIENAFGPTPSKIPWVMVLGGAAVVGGLLLMLRKRKAATATAGFGSHSSRRRRRRSRR